MEIRIGVFLRLLKFHGKKLIHYLQRLLRYHVADSFVYRFICLFIYRLTKEQQVVMFNFRFGRNISAT